MKTQSAIRLSRAQIAAHKMLADAVLAAPDQHVAKWIFTAITDDPRMSGDDLEVLGNAIARAGHLKTYEGKR